MRYLVDMEADCDVTSTGAAGSKLVGLPVLRRWGGRLKCLGILS